MGKRWSSERLLVLKDYIESGYTVPQIAERMDITRIAVKRAVETKLGGIQAVRKGIVKVRTQDEFAALMGVSRRTVAAWRKLKLIQPKRNRGVDYEHYGGRQRGWLFTERMITAFLEDRHTWPMWEPSAITDPATRAFAEGLRREAGGTWLSPKQVGERLGFAQNSIRSRIVRGLLPAHRIGMTWWIWSATVERKTHADSTDRSQ